MAENQVSYGLRVVANESVKDSTRLTFAENVGHVLKPLNPEITGLAGGYSLPGVVCLELAPAIGTDNEGVQDVSQQLYNYLTHKISGAKQIEKTDYFMYILATKSISDSVSYLKAIYSLIYAWKTWNKFYPKALLQAYGVDTSSDWIDLEIDDFRTYINKYITGLNTVYFPNIRYINSGIEFNRTILLESGDIRHAQTYVTPVRTYYKWDPTSDPNGTKLQALRIQDNQFSSLSDIKAFFNQLKEALVEDADATDIGGWIANVYEGNLLKFAEIKPDEKDLVKFVSGDKDALNVIENATFMNINCETALHTSWDITQQSNKIMQAGLRYNFGGTGGVPNLHTAYNVVKNAILNMHVANPSEDAVIKARTLQCVPQLLEVSQNSEYLVYYNVTSEYVVRNLTVYYYSGTSLLTLNPAQYAVGVGATYSDMKTMSMWFALQCKHMPNILFGETASPTTWKSLRYQYNSIDFDNWTIVDSDLHEKFWEFMWYDVLGIVKE